MDLNGCALFEGIAVHEQQALLKCLSGQARGYAKGEWIWHEGERATQVGVVLSGGVQVVREDFWGNRAILAHLEPGGLFGEAFSCAQIERLPVSVLASESSQVLLIDIRKLGVSCASACSFHARLIQNMLRVLASKNVALTQKIGHLTKRTTREKLLSYLSERAQQAGGSTFELPFNRQELADYLSVDRSALSSELGRMRDEGLLRFQRNHFELL